MAEMSIDQMDPTKEESDDSMDSSPEGDAPPNNAQQESQQPKRKGGRKPIYATSEERKQRNRQAQAAFRERRTEYIKQLEEAIHTHEQNLSNLQAAHRHAADECLMLRYKNSLLERILLEKGIDVQAELRAKTGSPNLGPTHMPHNLVHPPPIQRALLHRHHSRRSNSSVAPKLEPGVTMSPLPAPIHSHSSAPSPKNRPTPSSHSASPTATSYSSQHSASLTGSDQMGAPIRPAMPPTTSMKAPPPPQVSGMAGMASMAAQRQMQMAALHHGAGHMRGGVGPNAPPFYPTPSFQNHIEQLGKLPQQEYDAADMMDDPSDPPDTPNGPGPYPGASYPSPTPTGPPGGHHMGGQSPMDGPPSNNQHPSYPSMTQLLDPGFEFDPFGLSASMAFPTQFSFDTSNMR